MLTNDVAGTGMDLRGDSEFAKRLREETCAVRIHVGKFGVRKALNDEQMGEISEHFVAFKDALRATKRLIPTRHPAYLDVIRVQYQAKVYWRGNTVPYTEPGWRLIRRSKVDRFLETMKELEQDLKAARKRLAEAYSDIREQAKSELGSLFNADDYPSSIDGAYTLEWDFPSVEPPDYLRQLNPELYERQMALVASRFQQSLEAAEQMLAAELQKLVAHMAERLRTGEDGKAKQVRASCVDNLSAFFGRFREMGIGSNGQLNQLVEQAEALVKGVDLDVLKTSADSRASLAESMTALSQSLDGLIVNAPIRAITLEDETEAEPVGTESQTSAA